MNFNYFDKIKMFIDTFNYLRKLSVKMMLPIALVGLAFGMWLSNSFVTIGGGVAIFLFGMVALEQGFKAFTGGIIEKTLKKSTDKLYKSISFGCITTALVQSSSLVSLLTISFLSAGLIGLYEGIGIIFGANIGTTSGAWLMAVGVKINISKFAMPMIIFGVIMSFQKVKSIKGLGYVLTGLGFLFLGIHFMKEGFNILGEGVNLSDYAVGGFKGLLLFTLVGVVVTVIMQSSHATIILVIAALAERQIIYENAIALTIGANIGTTITAVLGSISSNVNGKRLAGAHLIFNLTTAIIAIILINPIISIVDYISSFLGIDTDNFALRLAVFDTFFQVMGVLLMTPFISKLVSFLKHTIKQTYQEKTESGIVPDTVRFLNKTAIDLPDIAYTSLLKETSHLYDNVSEAIAIGLNLKKENIISEMPIKEVLEDDYAEEFQDIEPIYNNRIEDIYDEIIDFSTKAQSNLYSAYFSKFYDIQFACRDMVSAIKETQYLQKNLQKYLSSSNKYIKNEYYSIRKQLVLVLRDIELISKSDDKNKYIILSELKKFNKSCDLTTHSKLNSLIRKDLIGKKMATSLMNDTTHTNNITNKLIAMVETVFVLSQEQIEDDNE